MNSAWFIRPRAHVSGVLALDSRVTRPQMTRVEAREIIRTNIGKRLRITFNDGMIRAVDIGSVDDEGFRHSGPDGDHPNHYWTRFEEVKRIHRKITASA